MVYNKPYDVLYTNTNHCAGHAAHGNHYLSSTRGWDTNMSIGIILQKGALWIGVHYSPTEKRYCINLIPGVTIWIATAEGRGPKAPSMLTWKF
jgi:hypothetical protein